MLAQTRLSQIDVNAKKKQKLVTQQILVVENNLLLGAGLENLLSRETNLKITGIAPRGEEELIEQIKKLRPAIVILDEATYLTHSVRLLAYLRILQKFRLVIVSANSNLIQIYHKENILLTQTIDLIKILQHQ